jgi:hypothetical protein
VKSRLHSAHRHAKPFGQISITPVFRIFQEEQFRVARRQASDRLPHQLLRLPRKQPGERVVVDGFVSRYAAAGVALDESPSPTRTSAIL